ncbi:MAG: PQQ-dependent sugar dehydrogenase [Phycisphaerales bacterium]|jgi:glucose/arabinose dehydrogenase|nr:PQQ-dependent sugar dehydrogenase [Phycisphaerales bacterium]
MLCIQTILVILLGFNKPQFVLVHEDLSFDEPIQAVFDGVSEDVLYVAEKGGAVRRVSMRKEEKEKPLFLDIRDRVGVTHDEEGLLSIVFHPNYEENRQLYVWYSAQGPKRCVLSRFTASETLDTADRATESVILEIRQPWGNHNGGMVLFGEDGYLYLGIGDGGAANDPYQNGQNKKSLLGTIIRIDVNNKTEKLNYAIPSDNPFVGVEDVREEIWAWGLRNPWRMSFDKQTNLLWVGDVGQNAWEEIDIIKSGENYGWNLREGKHEFKKNTNGETTTDPVFEYGRRQGGSITGGYVYRGKKIPQLVGSYVFADYLSRRVWFLEPPTKENKKYTSKRMAKKKPLSISSFGETPSGEIICCGFDSPYATTGKIYLLELSSGFASDSTIDSIR